ncbi:MAG: efflux RND transporter periplasmic adaptor subunit [Pirellulales bacterium]
MSGPPGPAHFAQSLQTNRRDAAGGRKKAHKRQGIASYTRNGERTRVFEGQFSVRYPIVLCSVWSGLLLAVTAGCQPQRPPVGPAEPPPVPVSRPVQRVVTDYVDFTGRTNAVNSVDVRARVSGYLVEMPFKEGADVKAGDLLFLVDPRPYQAQYDQAVGQVNLYKAQLALAKANYARDQEVAKTPGAVSVQQLDQDKAAVDEADAAVKAFQASLEVYKLNLSFTRVTSPIDGQVSRYFMTLGNLVVQDQTLLTTVVSLDPMYVYFDVDEGTVLRVRKAINEGTINRYPQGGIPVQMALQGEADFPHQGVVDFVNNQVNPNTGSLSVRGVFANPKPANGLRLISPGMFVRVRLPIGQPHPAILVIDRAVGSDQGLKYVYVLDAENKVQYRRVTTGALEDDGLRVIAAGLKPNEWVVVGGLQQVRPRMQVKVDRMAMPFYGPAEGGESKGASASATAPAARAAGGKPKQ